MCIICMCIIGIYVCVYMYNIIICIYDVWVFVMYYMYVFTKKCTWLYFNGQVQIIQALLSLGRDDVWKKNFNDYTIQNKSYL